MENMVINRGNPRQVYVTVLGSNGVKIELSKCTDVELILWINGRSKRASNTQILNDILVSELTPSELDYLGEYSAQVKYTDNGVVSTSERVYLFRVANEFYRTSSGTGLSDGGTLEISVSTPQAINKGYSAYEIAVQNGYVGTEQEWIASLSQDSKEAAAIALSAAGEANKAADNANAAAASVNAAKDAAIQAAVEANTAAISANNAADSANTAAYEANKAANNANNKADLANTAALNADIAKTNAEKATDDANTAALNATNAANTANAKAVYANEQGDYAKQQGLNAVVTANEAATNANNAAFIASQQASYAKQQGDYAKTEAEGIDAKIATKANQSDLVQLEQEVNIDVSNAKRVYDSFSRLNIANIFTSEQLSPYILCVRRNSNMHTPTETIYIDGWGKSDSLSYIRFKDSLGNVNYQIVHRDSMPSGVKEQEARFGAKGFYAIVDWDSIPIGINVNQYGWDAFDTNLISDNYYNDKITDRLNKLSNDVNTTIQSELDKFKNENKGVNESSLLTKSYNVLDITKCTKQYLEGNNYENIIDNEGKWLTPYLALDKGVKYILSRDPINDEKGRQYHTMFAIVFYDSAKNYISSIANKSEFTFPENAEFVRFHCNRYIYNASGNIFINNIMLVQDNAWLRGRFDMLLKLPYANYGMTYDNGSSHAMPISTVSHLNVLCLGDSIVEFGNYPDHISRYTHAKCYNQGYGGTRLVSHPDVSYNAFSLNTLIKSAVDKNYTAQDTSVVTLQKWHDKLNFFKNIIWGDIDIVTINIGWNDFTGVINIGEISDIGRDTFYGCLYNIINDIYSLNNRIRIVFIGPHYRKVGSEFCDTYRNSAGKSIYDYASAISTFCNRNGIEYIDMFNIGYNKINFNTYILSDGAHCTPYGYYRMGQRIASSI